MSTNQENQGPAGQEQVKTEIITLTRYLTEEQGKHKEATGDFTYVTARMFNYKKSLIESHPGY